MKASLSETSFALRPHTARGLSPCERGTDEAMKSMMLAAARLKTDEAKQRQAAWLDTALKAQVDFVKMMEEREIKLTEAEERAKRCRDARLEELAMKTQEVAKKNAEKRLSRSLRHREMLDAHHATMSCKYEQQMQASAEQKEQHRFDQSNQLALRSQQALCRELSAAEKAHRIEQERRDRIAEANATNAQKSRVLEEQVQSLHRCRRELQKASVSILARVQIQAKKQTEDGRWDSAELERSIAELRREFDATLAA